MNLATISTPGVYINEVSAFSNSVVPAATAVPAFIGYTPQAVYEGKSYTNVAQKITSFADFQAIFCLPDPPAPADPTKQYQPQYYLVPQKAKPVAGDSLLLNGIYYSILPDSNTVYYLYNSVRLFYDNGGGDAYIVSVGSYGAPSHKPADAGSQMINLNVLLSDLMGGLQLLLNEQEPTMYICPEATLLSINDNATLMKSMLLQCSQMQSAISVFDVIGSKSPDPVNFMDDITTFRNSTGSNGLNYGAAYYPFIGTDIMSQNIDYTNLFGGDVKQLQQILDPNNQDSALATIFNNMPNLPISKNHQALLNASQLYTAVIKVVAVDANLLPPSGGMAGVMATTDNVSGVWTAPANISIVGAVSLPIKLSESQQANLNVDAVSGKSINAIRFFNGIGILIWGARTLDGNSQDWRYLSVRRTLIMIEQSCKLAVHPYVFQPNVKNTWEAVKAVINSFLTSIWKEGGLQGASSADAFSVDCGLDTTMTADDISNGFMNVTVKVAVVRPAEFIVITFQQQMATSS